MADKTAHARVVYDADDKNFQRTSKRVNKTTETISKNFKIMALAAAAGAAALGVVVKRALEAAESLSDMANKANAGVEGLQELRFAASQNGASVRDMDDALTRLTRRMSMFATDGGGPAAKAIEALNLQILDADGNLRQSDDVFIDIAKKFETLSTNAEKAALASQLFGEDAGPRLVPLLNQGTAGIAEFTAKAREMGLVLDEEGIRKAAEVNAKIRALGESFRSQLTSAVIDNADAIDDLIVAFGNLGSATPTLVKALSTIIEVAVAGTTAFAEWRKSIDAVLYGMGLLEDSGGGATSPDRTVEGPEYRPTEPRILGPDGTPMDMLGSGRGGVGGAIEFDPVEAAMNVYNARLEAQMAFEAESIASATSHAGTMAEVAEHLRFAQIDTSSKMFSSLATSFQSGNDRLSKIMQAAGQVEALINTYRAASQALADPTIPVWGKFAAVGAVIASGMNLVNSIKTLSSSGGGARAGGGASSPSSVPSAAQQGPGQFVNVALTGGDMFSRDAVIGLIGRINEAVEDGAQIRGIRAG